MRYLQLCSLLLALSACATHSADIDVACEIDPQNNYLLKWETTPRIEGEVHIYQSTDPERFDTEKTPIKVASIQTGYTLIPDSIPSQRSYFLLRFNGHDDHIVGARAERLKYIENFRDLGGYTSKNGKQLRWGKIFRSGEFNTLTASSINRLKNMGIKTLIDFRDSEDVIKPSPELGLDNVINLPGALHYRQNLLPRLQKEELRRGDANLFMQDLYVAMVSGSKRAFKSMFNQLLVEDNYPIVLSCVNGKDYTGFAVSLLLSALDMPEEVIMNDYLLSNRYFDKRRTAFDPKDCCDGTQEALSLIQTADSRFLSYARDYIRQQYGSINNYLEEELGVTPEKRKQLKQYLLH